MAMPLLAIVLALIVGAVIIILTSALKPGASIDSRPAAARLSGPLRKAHWAVRTVESRRSVQAAPLILAGLGVGLAFKAGLFNIGGEGQYLLGGYCCRGRCGRTSYATGTRSSPSRSRSSSA